MDIEVLKKLSDENPAEYVRMVFEESSNKWYDAAYLLSDHVKEALMNYLSSSRVSRLRMYKLIHAVNENDFLDTPVEQMIQDMADCYSKSPLYEFIITAIEEWVHEDTPMLKGPIDAYFDFIGNCIYEEKKHPIVYVTDAYLWTKSINAQSHMEILIRYLNDKLSDEYEYKCWRKMLPTLFSDPYNYSCKITGLYYLFIYQMFILGESFFTFTPLTLQTKSLLTLCFYECKWMFIEKRYNRLDSLLRKWLHEDKIFFHTSDIIINENLYLPENLDPDYNKILSCLKDADLFEIMEYGDKNMAYINQVRKTKIKNEQNFEKFILNCLRNKNKIELLIYAQNKDVLFVKSLLKALEIILSEPVSELKDRLTKKYTAEAVMQYYQEYSPNHLKKIDENKWAIVYQLAQDIIKDKP